MRQLMTDRLILRNFRETDAKAYYECHANPRANCFIQERTKTVEAAEEAVRIRIACDSFIVMSLKGDDTLVGDLFWEKEEPDTFSVGWQIRPEHEGMGYMLEGAGALLEYLFMEMGGRRIYAYVEEDNYRSQKLCGRLGMRQEGCFREFISFIDNDDGTPKYENTFQYALLKKEWLAMHDPQYTGRSLVPNA